MYPSVLLILLVGQQQRQQAYKNLLQQPSHLGEVTAERRLVYRYSYVGL